MSLLVNYLGAGTCIGAIAERFLWTLAKHRAYFISCGPPKRQRLEHHILHKAARRAGH